MRNFLMKGLKMIRFEKEYLPDKPIFLGTTQHALRLDSDVNILVGFKFNDEIRQVHNVKVKSYQLGKLPKLGAALPIGEITGTALSGYKAELIQNYDDSFEENFENDFSRLVDIKNISNYQILKGNDDMTDLTKSPDLTSQNIARLREIFGLSQLEFANKVGVGKRTIQYIENGKQKISKNVIKKLRENMPELKTKFDVQFDWLSITFPDLIGEQVIYDVLKLDRSLFTTKSTSLQFYSREYAFAGEHKLFVLDFEPKVDEFTGELVQDLGTTVTMTGQGIRIFEKALFEQNLTWRQFFDIVERYRGHATRIDVAINDKLGLIDMNQIIDKVRKKLYWTKFRKPMIHGLDSTGWTAVFGKRPFVIRMYDKKKEQAEKGNETDILTRIELEYRDERADELLNAFIKENNLVGFVFDCLYTYIWFTDDEIPEEYYDKPEVRKNIENDIKPLASWALFVSIGKTMRFRHEPREQTVNDIEKWVLTAVVPSLQILKRTGRFNEVLKAMEEVELRPDQEKLIMATTQQAISRATKYLNMANVENLTLDELEER